ncbi:MAG TPA: hypothetical protein VFE46_04165, partial [Pirellulales bacterium]|nr:hypothetical protein [Pirellulales bacterium]
GVLAEFTAGIVVWCASAMGMLFGEFIHGPNAALTKLLFGMVIRMVVPLAACLMVLLAQSRLASAGFVFYVLLFYLTALPIDTTLAVVRCSGPRPAGDWRAGKIELS